MNPNHLIKIKDQFFQALKNPKIFKFLHLPVQSGSNQILKNMNRQYQTEDFTKLVNEFLYHFPQSTFATDVIVGFPGESEEQYQETLNLIKTITPDVLNISRFWPRPHTEAEKLPHQIPSDEIKRRSRITTDIFQNIAKMQNEKWLHWEGYVLINEKGKNQDEWIAKNFAYKQVIVNGDFQLGQIIKAKITKVSSFYLKAI